ncbi:biotin--[acetyl-CoA-carboxylase] ligase [Legionella geestiana]|uniref:biotin--[acetyl-CoA-carboxylase] ligase n=1 Tax=Legionella geestiana TaxID=45065 RepID=UPI0010926279|nr:biotin--[acetyl-CoA-carboxylase] ligase [Legionella geestiana]QDQ40648.1 biotin--[acetyl-CoA-carboxylase] ligase [Legionella geestiana]
MNIPLPLLHCLKDGDCHSGEQLGARLGISRSAIWKQIRQLELLGLKVQSIQGLGYRLEKAFIPLDAAQIEQALLKASFSLPFRLHLFPVIDSTNRFLRESLPFDGVGICCAEMQTAGRGRLGRTWHSPFGENIYCSIRWRFSGDISALAGLSLVVSLAVLEALSAFASHERIEVKWPNDLYWQGKKLAGCLVEAMGESNSGTEVIIGIGINTNADSTVNHGFHAPWCALMDLAGQPLCRNTVIAAVLVQLERALTLFSEQGFSAFLAAWETFDCLRGRAVSVSRHTDAIEGIASGVNALGQLGVLDGAGVMHWLSSGDASLRGHYRKGCPTDYS